MNKKRLIIAGSILTTAIVALSVSLTLAWYGAADRLNVENLELTVATTGDIRLSTTGEQGSFTTELTEDDLGQLPSDFLFAPVSSMCKSEWMNQKADKPSFYDCSFKQITSSGVPYLEESDFGFYRKDLYILSNTTHQYATLDFSGVDKDGKYTGCIFETNDNSAHAKQLAQQNPQWHLSAEEIEKSLDNLINCLRVSILVKQENFYRYYIIDPMKKDGEVTYLGGRLDNDANGYYDTYSDIHTGELKEVVYGEVNDRSLLVYKNPSNEQGVKPQEKDQYFSSSFDAISRPNAYTYDAEASIANNAIAVEDSYSPADIDKLDTDLLIPLEAGVPTKITLSYYLEGWDLDCINATMGASFKSKLSFKLKGGNI